MKNNPISIRRFGEKLPGISSAANAILKTDGGGGNTKTLQDYQRLACERIASLDGVDHFIQRYRNDATTITKNPPSPEDIDAGEAAVRKFVSTCNIVGLRKAGPEYRLVMPLNDVVRVSGRIDLTLVDSDGNWWQILFRQRSSKATDREYMFPIIQHWMRRQYGPYPGEKPQVGIYNWADGEFQTFHYPIERLDKAMHDVRTWADGVREVVLDKLNLGTDS